jgi:hypothetical protein
MFTTEFEKKAAGPSMSLGSQGSNFAAGMEGKGQPSGWDNLKSGISDMFGSGSQKPPIPPKPPTNVAVR